MKRAGFILFIAGIAGFVLLGTSCASAGREALIYDVKPIALVTVVSNVDINWRTGERANPNLVGSATRRTLRADSDLAIISTAENLISTAERLFRDSMAASGGLIDLVDRETVFNSRAYQEAELNRRRMSREHALPAGYRLIDPRNRDFPQALAAETGIQRTMFLEFTFSKAMRSGFGRTGTGGADVDMRVVILNDEGRTLYSRTFSMGSRGTVSVSNGVYSESGLMSLFESVILDASFEFLYHLEGI